MHKPLPCLLGHQPVGVVHDASPLAFEYAPAWLQRQPARPVAAIPLQPGRQQSDAVQAFFENLLPEGTALDDVVAALALRDPQLAAPLRDWLNGSGLL